MQKLNKGKKGNKKRNFDIFSKKEWYDVKVPTYFNKTKVRLHRIRSRHAVRVATRSKRASSRPSHSLPLVDVELLEGHAIR